MNQGYRTQPTQYLLLLAAACLSLLLMGGTHAPANRVSGRVTLTQGTSPLVGRASSYDSPSQKKSLMTAQHAIVIFYPLDFQPTLSPTPRAVITQKGEQFIPVVTPITRGSTVYILNEDNQYHNVYSRTPRASFNIGRRPPGAMYPQKINKTGVIKLFCDIHDHMQAFVVSLETPYFAKVRSDGSYTMNGLPDGRYRVEVFHPKLPSSSREIQVKGGQSLALNFALSR
ncbi:MAG: carboxypeptidase regulatory-like domain-containing protein [Bacteroidota bacterium]